VAATIKSDTSALRSSDRGSTFFKELLMHPPVSKLIVLGAALTLAACASYPALSQIGEGRFAEIHRGLTQEQVRGLAGAPASVSVASGEPHWIYPFVDAWGMRAVYDVAFDAGGHVARTSSMRVGF
jgi:hypothetical protein